MDEELLMAVALKTVELAVQWVAMGLRIEDFRDGYLRTIRRQAREMVNAESYVRYHEASLNKLCYQVREGFLDESIQQARSA